METDLLIARIDDTAEICSRTQKPKYLGFLSQEQAVLAERILKKRNCKFSFFGGYEDSERVILGCFPDWCDEFSFPLGALTFKYRTADALTHRDVLGSLMALGLTRESVGDILIEDGRAVVFTSDEVIDYIKNQVTKIGRTGVTVKEGFSDPLPGKGNLTEFTDTVASLRLDCIVSALCALSRSKAVVVIESGLVSINSAVSDKITRFICDGDIITVRGKGKFIISSTTGRTKKDRIILKYKKYV